MALTLAACGALTACDSLSPKTPGPVSIVWSAPLSGGDAGWIGFPGVSGNLVIAQTGPSLQAFDIATGRSVWTTQLRTGHPVGAENVATANGRAFVASADSVYALNAATGGRLWAFLPDDQGALCQIVADSVAVYVGTLSHRVYALTADSGHVLWSVDVGPAWTNPGAVNGIAESGDTLYVSARQYLNPSGGLRTAQVLALARATGAELWRYVGPNTTNDANRAPTVSSNLLLIADLYGGTFFALDRFSGAQVWRDSTTGLGPAQGPIVAAGVLYVGAGDQFVYSTDPQSGTVRWKVNTGGSVDYVALCGSVLLANNLQLHVLDTSRGKDIETLLTGDGQDYPTSAFAVSGRRAFVIGNAGAYGLSCPQ